MYIPIKNSDGNVVVDSVTKRVDGTLSFTQNKFSGSGRDQEQFLQFVLDAIPKEFQVHRSNVGMVGYGGSANSGGGIVYQVNIKFANPSDRKEVIKYFSNLAFPKLIKATAA